MNVVMPCLVCDGHAIQSLDRLEVPIGARRVMVEAERMRCQNCGESFLTPDQMDAAQVAASSQIRREEGLLFSQEIRAIRYKLGLSQPALERLISAGPKTVVRWERGTVFQNKTTDELLRLIRDVPGVYEHLAVRKGLLAAELMEPAPASHAGVQKRYGAPETPSETLGVIDIRSKWPKEKTTRRVEPDAELPPLPQEAIK